MEAEQFHLDCIDLLCDKQLGLIYQKLPLGAFTYKEPEGRVE